MVRRKRKAARMDESDLFIHVSDELRAALQRQAETNGRTVEEEARAILFAALDASTDKPS